MHSIKMNRRAVSPIIATLLLVAIVVAAAILTYSWTMSMARNQGEAAQVSLKIDKVEFDTTTDAQVVTATVRNTGSTPVTIKEAYLFDNLNAPVATDVITEVSIGIGKTNTVVLSLTGNDLESGLAFRVQYWTATGYYVEGVFYVP